MSKNKLSKRLLMLSAAITMMLCQSAFAAEEQVNAEVQAVAEAPVVQMNMQEAMVRAFETNPAIKIAGFEKDAARAQYNAARASRWFKITGSASASRGGLNEDFAEKYVNYLCSIDYNTHEDFNDLHMLFGCSCALAELQEALPGKIISEKYNFDN